MADPIVHPGVHRPEFSAPLHARAEIIATLRAALGKPNTTLVGAAIGTGMAAQAASRGGADFILALNAGRLRSMGAPSIFSLLALRKSNDFVLDFAQSEILPFVKVPVFFGASAFDPRCSIEAELERIADAGFGAIVNFPTSIFLDGRFRADIEGAGLGFQRELEMLRAAQKRNMATLAYVRTVAEAQQAATAGVDIINLNLGWNVGGTVGSRTELSLRQAAEYAKIIFRQIRAISEDTLCVLEGGPIVSPDQMYEVSALSKADGYIGGSTIDRVPLEASMEQITSAFKSVGTLQKRIDELERQLEHVQREYSIVGRSPSIQQIKQRIEKLAASSLPVMITGQAGTGKKLLARGIHEAARRSGSKLISSEDASGESLFGFAPSEGGRKVLGLLQYHPKATLLIESVECLCVDAQERLIEVIETGAYRRLGDNERGRFEGRLILASTRPLPELGSSGQLIPALESRLAPGHVFLPPLCDRLEDLPLLAEHFLQALRKDRRSRKLSVDHSAYRVLMTYGWPENIRELRSVLETAAIRCEGDWIKSEHLPPLGDANADAPHPHPGEEREWILDALQRHRFRRGEAARYLGISRKTLYNKMRVYGLPLQPRERS
ncbi:conserved probable sigma-54 dependent transcription regulator y4pA (plasmid) [Sinorhizobium fredii NGR234]|uniref:Putative transcriptional regulatory protein y4pA n=1 Tax=Sinorhizobium fredii (strain NBRC 101917 / NGR234) TaxID=394 RepID=Y4PA_SINFN|nr:sigma-54-dependent Fis family transcriptional regulator [Sinorhizobium fredii]P55610.1 RecName: Full=Putative transcriptional regulatory protein y4pA [Sinorhizobium fredii NGR234]AAB91811.1 conserved probable sigma-54 dependent transcription regulator y4pA [Sinorhizobium fredii NGR234]